MMKKLFTIILFTGFILSCFSQDKYLKSEEEINRLVEHSVQLFKDKKISESFTLLTPYWPMPQNELNTLEIQTQKYMDLMLTRFGEPVDYLKLKEQHLKNFAIKITYIIRFEKHAVRLIYIFYNSGKGWILNTFHWDDQFAAEFDH